MMRLLIAFLLVCGLALPAVAAPLHCASMPATAAMHHGAADSGHADRANHADHKAPPAGQAKPAQDCLGCAALKLPPMVARRDVPPTALIPTARRLPPLVGRSAVPETPPPRIPA